MDKFLTALVFFSSLQPIEGLSATAAVKLQVAVAFSHRCSFLFGYHFSTPG